MKKVILLLYLIGIGSIASTGQQPAGTPPEDPVVRISTDLIQIDVTVTDKSGKAVPGLSMADFEVYENGEKQTLSGAYYMTRSMGGATIGGPAGAARSSTVVGGGPVAPISPESVRRTIAIVVDDLTMSFGSVYYTRRALRRFVEQQMQPGDLVAIIRTAGSVGALQQFTTDKQVLLAAIDSIRWNPLTSDVDALTPTNQTPQEIAERFRTESNVVAQRAGQDSSGRLDNKKVHESITQTKARDFSDLKNANPLQEGIYAQASLGTMRYIIQGMNELPGRKLMMLFSDGFEIGRDSTKSRSSVVGEVLQDLAEFANRSSVVVYTYDTRGLKSMSIQASDSTYEVIDGHRGQKERLRLENFKEKQDGLIYLAKQTGGQALLDSNDLNGGIQRSLDEQSGYYLLAYVPNAESFDPSKRRFNKLEVKVLRPGLEVASRSGFFSTAAEDQAGAFSGPQNDLSRALTSPFTANQIAVSTNSLFADDAADGPYIRSLLHIDARSLTFADAPEGWKTATFDIAAVAFGNNGVPAEKKEAEYTIKAKGATLETMLAKGFVYVLIVPIKTPGVYQYRVAVRDKASGKIGSAAQVVDVPNLSKKRLTLSNLMIEDVSMAIWQNIAAGKVGSAPGQIQVPSTLLYDTVLRRATSGTVLRYGFEVYNAKGDGQSMPKLETQAKILQNNAVIVEGNLNKVDVSRQVDPKHIKVSGAIMLKDTLQPGDYLLQLTVFDRGLRQTATQVFALEIVK
jgi:VWFA-related protein